LLKATLTAYVSLSTDGTVGPDNIEVGVSLQNEAGCDIPNTNDLLPALDMMGTVFKETVVRRWIDSERKEKDGGKLKGGCETGALIRIPYRSRSSLI
jgi:hypothetical protein